MSFNLFPGKAEIESGNNSTHFLANSESQLTTTYTFWGEATEVLLLAR
jgi:hypothetical protein